MKRYVIYAATILCMQEGLTTVGYFYLTKLFTRFIINHVAKTKNKISFNKTPIQQ